MLETIGSAAGGGDERADQAAGVGSVPTRANQMGDGATPTTIRISGADRDRTGDPLLAKQVLSQLSYRPEETGEPT
jgi:hypothetical protein